MPWEGAKGPEYTADVQRFFELTRGHVILLGPRTSVPAFAHEDRTVVAIRSSERPADVISRYPDRVVYIGGGPPVWTAPTRHSSAIGTSRGSPMTARRTGGSIRPGSSPVEAPQAGSKRTFDQAALSSSDVLARGLHP
jgi:hypothetical protein